jgi:hypothetical protein
MIDREPQEISLRDSRFNPDKDYLMGYKGNSYLDAGYFYAPYIPMTTSPVVLDPNSFTPQKGILTRYGKKLLDQSLFGAVAISNFENDFVNDNTWTVKKKKKKLWRDITEDVEVSRFDDGN